MLDTNALLFWLAGSKRMKAALRDRLVDPENTVYVSAVSAFEIAVKASLGRLTLPGEPAAILMPFLERSRLSLLPMTVKHSFGVYALPPHHTDPFDRMLIAQALAEDLTIVTSDRQFSQYDVKLALVK